VGGGERVQQLRSPRRSESENRSRIDLWKHLIGPSRMSQNWPQVEDEDGPLTSTCGQSVLLLPEFVRLVTLHVTARGRKDS
jgi:hypothetical protein